MTRNERKRLIEYNHIPGAHRPVGNGSVGITDPFFGYYVDLVADAVLPYQWEILNDRVPGAEKSHCLENFRIAAGEKAGGFYGAVFQDSDVYKWLEAVSYCMESGKGKAFEPIVDDVVDLISRAQRPDGYLNTYITITKPEERWRNLIEEHELYCAGYLIEAAVALFEGTGKRKLLEVALRFADLIAETFGPGEGRIHGYPGHQEIELALIRLHGVTGEARYLETARYFVEQRGASPNYFVEELESRGGETIFPEFRNYDLKYSQAHIPPISQRSVEGHAVRAMYLCASMADLARECGDGNLKEACLSLWENVTGKRMFVTGGVGSSGHLERFTADYDLPNERTYCETCASVGLMMFGRRMASLTGEARFHETVERALYNTVLAGISSDGLRYFYVNPLEVEPEFCLSSTSMSHVKPERQQWFSVACCPTNVARTLASLGQYIYAEDGRSLYINQFISSRAEVELDGDTVSISMESELFGGGAVKISVDAPVSLRVRMPSYAGEPAFEVNGRRFEPRFEKGYALFDADGPSEIVIRAAVAPRWVAANDRVHADIGKTALAYGPFVYCLEETDNGPNLPSIAVPPEAAVDFAGSLEGLPGGLPKLEYDGFRISGGIDGLYGPPEFHSRPVRLTAVPYCLWCNRTPGEMLVWQRVRI